MRTLLVIASQPALAAAIRSVVEDEAWRVIDRPDTLEAESMLRHGMVDVCVIDCELTDVQPIRVLREVRRMAPKCPVLVYAGERRREWEEEAYLLGVMQVLDKPVRGRLLNCLLERLYSSPGAESVSRSAPPEAVAPVAGGQSSEASSGLSQRGLEVLRDLSTVLSHSLCTDSLLQQTLSLLRKILGVNRAVIFVRPGPREAAVPGSRESRQMRPACSVGLETSLLNQVALSLDSGIGRQVMRLGRILRRNSEDARADESVVREFGMLGTEVAVPILDREHLIGVVLLDGHITGESLGNEELTLVFHLLEEIGLAIRNTWLHDQLSAHHEVMRDMLDQLPAGCLVIDRERNILHANPAALAVFAPATGASGRLEFRDLPPQIGGRVFQVLQSGHGSTEFRHEAPGTDRTFRIRITPFQSSGGSGGPTVLLLAEDITHEERTRQLEKDKANLDILKSMATHFAHEIGNAMVPFSVYQQMRAENRGEAEIREAVDPAMNDSIRRILRLNQQMLLMARSRQPDEGPFSLGDLIRDAFAEARSFGARGDAQLDYRDESDNPCLQGSVSGLKHGLAEILLNALQAQPRDQAVRVRSFKSDNSDGSHSICVDVLDQGAGFTEEARQRATEPFYSTRSVGLGLGLTVASRIFEQHGGGLAIEPKSSGESVRIRVSLPFEEQRAVTISE